MTAYINHMKLLKESLGS